MLVPIPTYEEPELPKPVKTDEWTRIHDYLNVPPWKCKQCNTVMFGRCKYCVYCKYKLGMETLYEGSGK